MNEYGQFPRLLDYQQQPKPDFIDWATEFFAKEFDGLVIRNYEEPV